MNPFACSHLDVDAPIPWVKSSEIEETRVASLASSDVLEIRRVCLQIVIVNELQGVVKIDVGQFSLNDE
jgi:hypothetical protein